MATTATLRWDADQFYFVSDDGQDFYEVSRLPEHDTDLDGLRPLGIRWHKDGGGAIHQITMTRRWLELQAQRPECGIEFGEVA